MKNNIKSNNQTNFLLQNNYVNDPNNMINPQKKPRKKCNCSGRDAKVDADLYFQLKEENFKLKQDRKIQDERMKKLEVSLANIKENLIKERKQADYKVITNNNDTNSDLEKTKMENRKLKSENEKKNMIIQGLQSNALIIKAKGKSKNKKKERDPLKFQNEKNDYLACISRLREQLKIANEDRRTLIAELRSKQISFNPSSNNKNIMNDRITSQIQTASIKIDTNDKILELTKKNLQNYIERYEKERENVRKLQHELSILKGENDKIPQYKILIDDLKNNEKKLEEELNDLRISPFIKQAEERGDVFRNYQISEKKLHELERDLEEKEKLLQEQELRLNQLEKENKKLRDDLTKSEIDKDKFKEQMLNLKISKEDAEQKDKIFQDKLNKFIQYGEVDTNFAKMLSLLKLQNKEINIDNININYFEQNAEKANDPIYLKSEIEKMKIEKGELGKELETNKALLSTLQQIIDETKQLQEVDKLKYQTEVKILKQKIEDLVKLIDVDKLPSEFLVQDPISGQPVLKDKNEILNELIPEENKEAKLLDDRITEFSEDETEVELSMNENALDIFFGECVYEDGLSEELGFNIDHILSFFSVDFYVHETQTSDILNGKTPQFNFQITFKVDMNEKFITYLESEYIYLDIYSLRDNVQSIFGKGKIRLKDLIEVEKSTQSSTRVINSIVSLYYISDSNLKIASIHYKMRMRKPLIETLKWYKAQTQFIREKNPVHDLLITKAEQNIKNYEYLGGKYYEVKILINKAVGILINNPGRKIRPYFYYKFYNNGEKYSQISSGNNPIFEDVSSFRVNYNKDFINYVEKENLNIYIFDSMNPIEIDINDPNQVKLVNTNQEAANDLIGICRVPLKGLLINDLVQGEFPIVNMKNEKIGILNLNIFWEEVNTAVEEEELPYETEAYKDALVLKLAKALKDKGLNLDSAFNIFDMDKKNEISIDNFKNIIIYTLKFTTNQNELEHLINLLFAGKSKAKLSKMDFYKIFSLLLPHSGPAASLLASSYNIELNEDEDNKTMNKSSPFLIQGNADSQFSINPQKRRLDNTQSMNNKEGSSNFEASKNFSNINNNIASFKNVRDTTTIINTNRSLEELGKLVFEHRMKMGGDISKIFKNLDKDASLGIDKRELRLGYKRMGIELSDVELNKLWRELSPDNKNISFNRFKEFHDKIFTPNKRKAIPINQDNN